MKTDAREDISPLERTFGEEGAELLRRYNEEETQRIKNNNVRIISIMAIIALLGGMYLYYQTNLIKQNNFSPRDFIPYYEIKAR